MKYLLLKKSRFSFGYELVEFETAEALTRELMENGIPQDAIVAERVGLHLSIGEWSAPAAETQALDVAEAA